MASRYTCQVCQTFGNFSFKPLKQTQIRTLPFRNTHSAITIPVHSQRRLFWSKKVSPNDTALDASTIPPLELIEEVQRLGAQRKSVAVRDVHGEQHILARVPLNDPAALRTYSWRSSAWTWGVLERLFEDCAGPGRVTFSVAEVPVETESNTSAKNKDTEKKVVSDVNGHHVGKASGWFFDELGLPKTFNTWAMVSFLHMWILKVRIRQFPQRMANHWNELLTNHFFWKAEEAMDFEHRMDPVSRKKYLDQYFQVWTATLLAYDEGLIKGDAVLASALWRLVLGAKEDVDPAKVALLVGYVRRELARVGNLEDKILARGYVGFGEPFVQR